MTVDEVIKQVAKIESCKGDDEVAHSAEDRLHRSVLQAIRRGHPEGRELAREALKTLDIEFCRWCA